ncbi:MAG: asparagine synthase B [bacterium]|nr:asparagine synthase B [bacterium]
MCSIFCLLDLKSDPAELRRRALDMSRLMRHRGPDWSGIHTAAGAILAHERLAIVDPAGGAQPLVSPDGAHVLAVNGEIYNHQELRAQLQAPYAFRTGSDCEVILALYAEQGDAFVDRLRGMFAFVLYDQARGRWLIARDHLGIVPLYTGRDEAGTLHVASELKALEPVCREVTVFPPGHLWTSGQTTPRRWWRRDWQTWEGVEHRVTDRTALAAALDDAVRSHLMSDVPYGVLVSGGLDSSVIAALAARHAAMRVEDGERSPAWWPRLHSFSVGLQDAPDLIAAREVAAHLGTVHHEVVYTVQEGLDAVPDVIRHLETFDVTTIRAGTPMYLLARRIRAMGIKMVLSGEGADEIFGGYLYFHKAPGAQELHQELLRKLENLHWYDCLRANKAMAAWGVEARVPFLDKEFLDVAMTIAPRDKLCGLGVIEKKVLRECFADLLPPSVAWRQKEQFSDGVGYGWIDALKATAERVVTDEVFADRKAAFPLNTPTSKEAYFYRAVFEQHFGGRESVLRTVPFGKSVACSTEAALAWDPSLRLRDDPSGRAVPGVHTEAYDGSERSI